MPKAKNVLVTGGAGFIGRWVVKALLEDTPHRVAVLDDLSNGCRDNLAEFRKEPRLREFVKAGIESPRKVEKLFESFKPDLCLHLAAQIIVQASIDDPVSTFRADVDGTFHLLELCRARNAAFLFMSTCMVYDLAAPTGSISESHSTVPRSPYAGAKLAGENMCLSYAHAYGLPVTVIRPFNTYGPHQKSSGEGGVVSIFLHRALRNEDMNIYGTGRQTRDLLFVGDCADFVLRAAMAPEARGEIFNAGTGRDISVNDLAALCKRVVPGTKSRIKHVKHIHPQSEIMKLCCNANKVKKVLGWKPSVKLEQGLTQTREWIADNIEQGRTTWS